MKRSLFLLLPLLFVGLLQAEPEHKTESAAESAKTFYTKLRTLNVRGLPNKDQWKDLAPLFTKELATLIESAQKEQQQAIQKYPDEKPPWIEGDLFSSLFEGPEKWTFEPATVKSETTEVPVKLSFGTGAEAATWTDTLILKHTDSGWLVDDIRYGGKWDFANQGTLKKSLEISPK